MWRLLSPLLLYKEGHQEKNHQDLQHQSTLVTQLIHYNESEMCDVLTNVIFLLLVLMILGCFGLIITLCVNPELFGIVSLSMIPPK
eukprot:03384.XXX_87424_88150_1 [CDS] Oithona nana genome sequencing.